MKINLVGYNFDENSGQGVFKFSAYLYENLKKLGANVERTEVGIPANPPSLLFKNILLNSMKAGRKHCHFLMPELSFPILLKRKSVVTFHDMIPYIVNERNFMFVTYFKLMCLVGKKAKKIIAVSESTKNDIVKYLKISKNKIYVIHEGVNHEKFYPRKKRFKENFVIGYLGGLGKRKNVDVILRAAKVLNNDNRFIFKIAGKGPELNSLKELAKKLKLKNIEFVGFVPEGILNSFYNSLDLFIFPSLYEGFGLPILEAMACGTPVITSNISSMPEICGDAAMYLNNPLDAEELSKKIKILMENHKLRKKLSRNGLKRSKWFTWERCAREHMKIYEEVWG